MNLHQIFLIAALSLIGSTCFAQESRTWTSAATGRQFSGSLVEVGDGSVSIRRDSDQAVFAVKLADLIPADRDWIAQHTPKPSPAGPIEDLSALIAEIPKETGTPAIGIVLVEDGETRGIGVSGVRKAESPEKVESDDRWHLGSCTKSMTATLAATFVEDGAIAWETTVSEVLGKAMKMLDAYEPVTLGQLLAHRGGIPGDVPESVYAGVDFGASVKDLSDRDLLKQRAAYAEAVLNLTPSRPPDSGFEYSNAGYVVAAVMLEKVSGKPWEKLMEERLFKPLGMTASGFGNAAREDKGKPTQPWPHQDGKTPIPPGPGDDNSWVIGPAGSVHASLKDVARYLAMHATGALGPVLKKPETFAYLHTAVPDNDNYARGWKVSRTAWSRGPAVAHDGSNTLNYCSFWVAPERKAAVAAFTNCAEKGADSCRAAIEAIVAKYLD
ncbi:MAG: beta-lactamase family protein [Verrucomicrobiae bacterium]|nr:beta-lactamase family protein [Verrucomicrobiae bacterium]